MNSKKGQSLLIPLAFNFALGALGFFVAIPSILRIGTLYANVQGVLSLISDPQARKTSQS